MRTVVNALAAYLVGAVLFLGPRPDRAAPAQAAQMREVCPTPLTLVLRPGLQYPGITIRISPYMPHAHVVVRVPLHPGARRSSRHFYLPAFDVPDSPFLRTALAEYRVSQPRSEVESWYYRAFKSCGFTWQGSGQTDDRHGHTAVGLDWGTRYDVHMTVELSLQAIDKNDTLIYYLADTITAPPRPKGSYLPPLKRASVRVTLPSAPGSTRIRRYQRTVERPADLARLRAAINGLAVVSPGPKTCPAIPRSATLVLTERNGSTLSVTDRPQCIGVTIGRYPPLTDTRNRVWKTVTRLAGA